MFQNLKVKKGWMPLRVEEIIEESWDTKTFVFTDAESGGRPFDFIAGQYLTFMYTGIVDKPVIRSYTMSGSPSQTDKIYVTVKRVEGGLVSNWMCDHLRVGEVLKARGPIGRFVYAEGDAPHLVMVAGGSGVTPFVSMLRDYISGNPEKLGLPIPKTMSLLVAYRSKEEILFVKEFEDLLRRDLNIPTKIFVYLTRENDKSFQKDAIPIFHGRPTEESYQRFFATTGLPIQDCTFMTCGPEALMNNFVTFLKNQNVDPLRIKTESFGNSPLSPA